MEDVDFDCNAKNSDQKTQSDEKQAHLNKRKHDMVLSVNKGSHFSCDETPTPTRFIRNCEAIGLFQDLQNVNPFDETFKKATEAVKKGEFIRTLNVSTLGKAAGEDLHTPHIDITASTHSSSDGTDDDVEIVVRTEADTSLRSAHALAQKYAPESEYVPRDKPKVAGEDLRLFVRMPDGSLVQIPTIGNQMAINSQPNDPSTPRTIIISTQSTTPREIDKKVKPTALSPPKLTQSNSTASAAVREKLKAALLKSSKTSDELKRCGKVVLPQPTTSPNSANYNNESPPSEARREKRVSSTTPDEDHEKKLKVLERNRIAAMRCREKRKKWVAELREKYDHMCQTNEALVKEVTFLRSEVVRLKNALLLASSQPLPVQDITATNVEIVPIVSNGKSSQKPVSLEISGKSLRSIKKNLSLKKMEISEPLTISREQSVRHGLRLDVEGATTVTVMDLGSPLVMRDEILTSAAQPITPNEKLLAFPELDRVDCEPTEDKILSSVIQINPHAMTKLPSGFS